MDFSNKDQIFVFSVFGLLGLALVYTLFNFVRDRIHLDRVMRLDTTKYASSPNRLLFYFNRVWNNKLPGPTPLKELDALLDAFSFEKLNDVERSLVKKIRSEQIEIINAFSGGDLKPLPALNPEELLMWISLPIFGGYIKRIYEGNLVLIFAKANDGFYFFPGRVLSRAIAQGATGPSSFDIWACVNREAYTFISKNKVRAIKAIIIAQGTPRSRKI